MPIRPRWAVAGALACAALLGLTWLSAFHIGVFENADQSAYQGFVGLHDHSAVQSIASVFVSLCNPNPYVYFAPVVVLIALLRGRPRVAFAVGAILLGANVTTQLLKPLLAAPRPGSLFGGVSPLPSASWPSGHSTAAMSFALALVVVSPARARPVIAALGAAFAVVVGYSLLAAGKHYPSDVLGGFLVAATWSLVAVATLLATERRRPCARMTTGRVSLRAALGPPGAMLIAALVLVGIAALSRPHDVVIYVGAHKQLVAVAAAIGALSLGLSTGVMLSVRR
jgi:membrane-associated phospholipid phosphatase